jgi:hypothetical protein
LQRKNTFKEKKIAKKRINKNLIEKKEKKKFQV